MTDTAVSLGSNVGWYFSQSQLLIVLGPEHAQTIANDGFSRSDVGHPGLAALDARGHRRRRPAAAGAVTGGRDRHGRGRSSRSDPRGRVRRDPGGGRIIVGR
jgi:hypothetical protein